MTKCLNLSGPQIRRLRYARGWSQSILAAKLELLGWDIDRVGVAKIEAQLVHVDDYELLYLARAFNVALGHLLPKIDPSRPIQEPARLLGVHYFSVYRMIQQCKLRACRTLRGKLPVPQRRA